MIFLDDLQQPINFTHAITHGDAGGLTFSFAVMLVEKISLIVNTI